MADDYGIDPKTHIIDALGFLKDWVTSIIQIETALLGGIGAAIVLKDKTEISLTICQTQSLFIAAVLFGLSIIGGIYLLNALPAAAQRFPISDKAKKNDIYSINTRSCVRIVDWTRLHRYAFLLGVIAITVFVFLRAFFPKS
jgi:hypothetical protein